LRQHAIRLIGAEEHLQGTFDLLITVKGIATTSAIQLMGELLVLPAHMRYEPLKKQCTPMTAAAEALYQDDPEWGAPLLWRSELRNVLALYMRKDLLALHAALALQERAEELLEGREFQIPSADVLRLAHASGCSAYDCEFVALAEDLGTYLYTVDRGLLRAFPDTTLPLGEGICEGREGGGR